MSITAAFAQGRAGLAGVAAWAEATSANVAGADRPGYARAEIRHDPDAPWGPGAVRIAHARSDALDRLLGMEEARIARQEAVADGLSTYAAALGQPGDPGGLGARIGALGTALTQLAAAPSSGAQQRAAVAAAEGLAGSIRDVARALEAAADGALARIEAAVGELNDGLARVAEANATAWRGADGGTGDPLPALGDLARIADLRALRDPDGTLRLHTSGGTLLLAGDDPAAIRFDAPTGRLLAQAGGQDVEITPNAAGVRGFGEGALAGEVDLYLRVLPRYRAQLDQLAASVVRAFEDADASLATGQAGLFTDGGGALSPGATDGLASRLAVNDAARPEAGGSAWRLRDGMAAAAQGPVGDGTQVRRFLDALEAAHTFDPGAGLGASATLARYAADLVGAQRAVEVGAAARGEALQAGAAAIRGARDARTGVDLDRELQDLVRIEQSYAANGKVIQTATRMLDRLLDAT